MHRAAPIARLRPCLLKNALATGFFRLLGYTLSIAASSAAFGSEEEKQVLPKEHLTADGQQLALIKEKTGINKLHILYLLQSGEFNRAIDLYQDYKAALGRHDFEVLQQMGLIILEQGARSPDPHTQLTSIFGSGLAGIEASIDILEAGIASPHPQTQVAAIQFLGHLQDDRCEELLTKAMSSDYFFTRVEAASQLAVRKARTAVGQIESLMHKVPPQMHFFFARFFAAVGTPDAITILRDMMDDPFHMTRIEAILCAARFGRDDLLPRIRSKATHLNVAEQEACCSALGYLKDSQSISQLKTLAGSPSMNVKLAASRALYTLGIDAAKEEIVAQAKGKNLFAISLLAEIPGSEAILLPLIRDPDIHVRFNAVFALLQLGDARVAGVLPEFLVRDSRGLGYQPQFSVGNSLMAWKVIPSAEQHQKDNPNDLITLSTTVREHMLRECLELSPTSFLRLAEFLFDSKQGELIPLLVGLVENLQTKEAIELLSTKAQTAGAPLTRAYCSLALMRLKQGETHQAAVLNWIHLKKNTEMIRFRPMLPWDARLAGPAHGFELTPEENSRLLIECYQTVSLEHDDKSIDVILEGLKSGHGKNRPVLAGLLIQAIQ